MSMLPPALIAELARKLYDARKTRTQLRHFSTEHPQMTIEDGYAIQREWVRLELADGHTIRGRKIGLTSRAMQQASQITEPDYAPLMDDMFFESGADIPIERFIAPRVEVELAFVLDQALRGPAVTLTDVLAATGLAAGVLDHPANGVAWLANKIARYDEQLNPGDIVLSGSFTRPTTVKRGDVLRADFGSLGTISVRFV